jgi:hypothetical protein
MNNSRAGDFVEIKGRVVDEQSRPVAGARVADFWRANGTGKDQNGKNLDLKVEANLKEFWAHLGEMESVGSQPRVATTDADGRFTVTIPDSKHALMAIDCERRRGGLQILPKGRVEEPIEIRLGPLTRIRGSLRGPRAGEKPHWIHVYVNLPEDPTRPLDSTRLVSCGSFEARFEMSLPPGPYVIHGYNEQMDAYLVPDRDINLTTGIAEVDLGVLMLSNARTHERLKIERAKSNGTWVDIADRYGKLAPRWSITDARGMPKHAQIQDFKKKWLLIYFWGLGCTPCLKTGLPSLVRFYEEHAADRDRFEIVAFCIDGDGELATIADLDRRLEPVVKHVWGGKPLPFPVVLDASFRTLESFGISTLGPHLVSPEGLLLQGDESVLAAMLEEQPARSRDTRPTLP